MKLIKGMFFIVSMSLLSHQIFSMEKDFPRATIEKDELDQVIAAIIESKNLENKNEITSYVQHMIKEDPTLVNTYRNGFKLIHYACDTNNLELVKLLTNSDKNSVNSPTITPDNRPDLYPVHIASKNGNIELLKFLLSLHASPLVEDSRNYSILHVATYYHHFDMIQYLINELKINPRSKTRERLTTYSMESTAYELEKLSPSSEHKEISELLVNAPDPKGEGMIFKPITHVACPEDIILEIGKLIKDGAELNTVNSNGFTPLDIALFRNTRTINNLPKDIEFIIAAHLIENGADVNYMHNDPKCVHNFGLTNLFVAVEANNFSMVKFLLEKGANPFIGTTQGLPLEKARLLKDKVSNKDANRAITALLLDYSLYYAVQSNDLANTEILLKLHANPNMVHAGATPLILATRKNGIKLMQKLLEYGAIVDFELENKSTALHVAAQEGFLKGAIVLLQAGADYNKQNSNNETPLVIAVLKGNDENCTPEAQGHCLEVFQLLRQWEKTHGPKHDAQEIKNDDMEI